MKKLLAIIFITSTFMCEAQSFQWAKTFIRFTTDMTIENNDLYLTGYFTGSKDFDPGIGTYTLSAGSTTSPFIAKYDSNLNILWAFNLQTSDRGIPKKIVLQEDHLYVFGEFRDTVDFDPGVGVLNLVGQSTYQNNMFIAKYDLNGNLIWAKAFQGTNSGKATGLLLNNDRILCSGTFSGTYDFDPSAFDQFRQASTADLFTCMLDTNGNYINVLTLGDTAFWFNPIVSLNHNSNNYFIDGLFSGSGDFNAGAGINTMTASSTSDLFILKLDANLNYLWSTNFGIVNSSHRHSLCINNLGNILIAGHFKDSIDCNPSLSQSHYLYNANNTWDAFIIQLNANGQFHWAKQMKVTSSSGNIYPKHIQVDSSDNIYISGSFSRTVDFDPDCGLFSLSTIGNFSPDGFLSKLDASGNFNWTKYLAGYGNSDIEKFILGNQSTVYSLVENAQGTTDFDPGPDTSAISSNNAGDAVILKLKQCEQIDNQNVSACDSFLFNGSTYYKTIVNTFMYQDQLGCDSIVRLNLSIDSTPSAGITANGLSLTANGGTASSTYQWLECNPYNVITGETNPSFLVTANGSFAVVISQNGCSDTSLCETFTNVGIEHLESDDISVYPNPTNGQLVIECPHYIQNGQLKLFNSVGQIELKQNHLEGKFFPLNIDYLANGIYILELNEGRGRYQSMVVKE